MQLPQAVTPPAREARRQRPAQGPRPHRVTAPETSPRPAVHFQISWERAMPEFLYKKAEIAANVAIIAIALPLGVALVKRFLPPGRSSPGRARTIAESAAPS